MRHHKLISIISQVLFYSVARFLPPSYAFLGRPSKKIRGVICKQIFCEAGQNVNIERGAYFGSGRQIEIGDNSGIGVNCHVPADICIGKDVMMGPDVLIVGRNQNHQFERLDIPMRLQGYKDSQPVVIEDDVWLGARVIILPGIRVGHGAVIGAGAIVTKDVPPFAICVGNPARVIRYRNELP